jgi:hypothetical protein
MRAKWMSKNRGAALPIALAMVFIFLAVSFVLESQIISSRNSLLLYELRSRLRMGISEVRNQSLAKVGNGELRLEAGAHWALPGTPSSDDFVLKDISIRDFPENGQWIVRIDAQCIRGAISQTMTQEARLSFENGVIHIFDIDER